MGEARRRGKGYGRNQEKKEKRIWEKLEKKEGEEGMRETRISKTMLKIHTTLEYPFVPDIHFPL